MINRILVSGPARFLTRRNFNAIQIFAVFLIAEAMGDTWPAVTGWLASAFLLATFVGVCVIAAAVGAWLEIKVERAVKAKQAAEIARRSAARGTRWP